MISVSCNTSPRISSWEGRDLEEENRTLLAGSESDVPGQSPGSAALTDCVTQDKPPALREPVHACERAHSFLSQQKGRTNSTTPQDYGKRQ